MSEKMIIEITVENHEKVNAAIERAEKAIKELKDAMWDLQGLRFKTTAHPEE